MKVLFPGHRYLLKNLKGPGYTELQFYQDPELHGGNRKEGPSSQEVIRALLERVQVLDAEKPHSINKEVILPGLRQALAGFEARALLRKAAKGYPLELLPTGADGHIV